MRLSLAPTGASAEHDGIATRGLGRQLEPLCADFGVMAEARRRIPGVAMRGAALNELLLETTPTHVTLSARQYAMVRRILQRVLAEPGEAQDAGRRSLLLLVRREGEPRFVALTLEDS